jgi:SET domain-containing protein
MQSRSGIRVGSAGKLGRGVFATKSFKKGDLIEVAPIIVLDWKDTVLVERTLMSQYIYSYSIDTVCIGLGYTSLYNHSLRPNAEYDVDGDRIEIRAVRAIKSGAQIKVNYNGDHKDKTPWEFKETKDT